MVEGEDLRDFIEYQKKKETEEIDNSIDLEKKNYFNNYVYYIRILLNQAVKSLLLIK